MQQSSPTQPSLAASSFAGLLATLTAPKPAAAEDESLWSSGDLGEDVASLSYERALRAHARYRPVQPPAGMAPSSEQSAPVDAAHAEKSRAATTPDRDLRSSSVTIRLSKLECVRLHERAAEAGLTISAYLRSCALEADVLRAEVKKALADLKTAADKAAPTEQPQNQRLGWIARFIKR